MTYYQGSGRVVFFAFFVSDQILIVFVSEPQFSHNFVFRSRGISHYRTDPHSKSVQKNLHRGDPYEIFFLNINKI